jgi:hypothetical protein
LQGPFTKSTVTIETANKEANHKRKGAYFFALALYKATMDGYLINDRFVKELFKVFFTLWLEEQFVDIVKCV